MREIVTGLSSLQLGSYFGFCNIRLLHWVPRQASCLCSLLLWGASSCLPPFCSHVFSLLSILLGLLLLSVLCFLRVGISHPFHVPSTFTCASWSILPDQLSGLGSPSDGDHTFIGLDPRCQCRQGSTWFVDWFYRLGIQNGFVQALGPGHNPISPRSLGMILL